MTKDKSVDAIPGAITEGEAAEEKPAEMGEAHRKQSGAGFDSGIVTEAEVKQRYSPDKVEEAKNEQAARHRAEAHPAWAEPSVMSEVDVVAEVPDTAKEAEKAEREAQPKRTTQNSKPRSTRSK
jgi:hypothetical protein